MDSSKNILVVSTESYTVTVVELDVPQAIDAMMYRLRHEVTKQKDRIVLKMDPISFVLKNVSVKNVQTGRLPFFKSNKVKKEFTAVIDVEIRYLKIEDLNKED